MGKSVTAPYVVEITSQAPPGLKQQYFTPMSWFVRNRPNSPGMGVPTEDSLAAYVQTFGKSLESTGPNKHISEVAGYIPYPTSAIVRRNVIGGEVVARWKAPMFQAW